MKIYFFYFALFNIILTNFALAKISDKRIYDNIYEACISKKSSEFSYNEFSNYCYCISNQVTQSFDIRELTALEKNINSVSDTKTKLLIAQSNKKFKKIIQHCISKFL